MTSEVAKITDNYDTTDLRKYSECLYVTLMTQLQLPNNSEFFPHNFKKKSVKAAVKLHLI